MDKAQFEKVLRDGEGMHVEFKRCGQKPEIDTFESICAFANRTGGSVYLGVLDDGEVFGNFARHFSAHSSYASLEACGYGFSGRCWFDKE